MRTLPVFHTLFVILFITFALLGGASPVSAQSAPEGPGNPEEVEAFMDGLMSSQMNDHHVAGAVVVIVKDGSVLFSKGYGYADLETRTPVDPQNTLFRPGSISKLFVWTSVMQLVEQGKLDLDADVNQYLDFKIPATFPQPVTLKSLMTHTPGFEDVGNDLFKLKPESVIPLDAYLKKNLPSRVFPPGKYGAYSNYGTALAGYIVERVSGLPFYEYVEKNILSPLGMEHATFRQPLPTGLINDMSSGYNYVNGGYIKAGFEYVVAYPAGSLSASGLEMAKFMLAHLQNGRFGQARILKDETARQMHSQLFTADPRIHGMAYGFFNDVINGQQVISHGGDTLLFHSELFLLPEKNVGVFISTNSVGGARVGSVVTKLFLDHYYPVNRNQTLVPTSDFDSRINQYVGNYYLARSNFTTFEKILSGLTPISVSVNQNKDVLISLAGETTRYVEVEPGLLVNPEQPDKKVVMKVQDGQISLQSSDPFAFIKAPWYASLGLHLLIFIGGGLLFLFTLLGWLKSFFSGLLKHEPRPALSRLARLVAGLFGLVFLAFIVILLVIITDNNPAYGVPNLFFEVPAWFNNMMYLPLAAVVLGILMLPLAILAWIKHFWTLPGRLFYTLLTLFAFAILWAFKYWNFLQ